MLNIFACARNMHEQVAGECGNPLRRPETGSSENNDALDINGQKGHETVECEQRNLNSSTAEVIADTMFMEEGEDDATTQTIDIQGGVKMVCKFSISRQDIENNSRQYLLEKTKEYANHTVANNFYKGVKWAPDGSHLLTCTEDNHFRLYQLPDDMDYQSLDYCGELLEVTDIPAGELIYDYAWYPHMRYWEPTTCVYITCTRDHPIHLREAATGAIRCTYRPYNHLDEVEAPKSVAFNPDGTKIYCGFEKMIRIFDTSRPGRDHIDVKTLAHKRAKGQRGIISTIAFSPATPSLYAAGSYDRSIALYVDNDCSPVARLKGSKGGVTQVKFSPDGLYVYSGGRKDDYIMCWDVRMGGKLAGRMKRTADTNQRLQFDIDPQGKYIATGSQDATIRVFDLNSDWPEDYNTPLEPVRVINSPGPSSINGVNFHPYYPLLSTVSGQRVLDIRGITESESDSEQEKTSDTTTRLESFPVPTQKRIVEKRFIENTVRIWTNLKW